MALNYVKGSTLQVENCERVKKKILKVDILLFLQHAENQYQGNTENFIHLSSNVY